MSRCFPYPPPGYTLSRASNEALIESIKLQKEKEKAKNQKEKRREKKEKKKGKKDKRREKKDDANHKLHNFDTGKSQIAGKVWPDKFSLKGKEAETEQLLERSSLTDEHGQPMCSNLPSTSSDSTNTSNKRKRHTSPLKDSCGHGNIIRIKFTPKRQNDSNASANEVSLCSKSGGSDLAAQNTNFNNLRDGRESSHSAVKTDREQICTTSRPVESVKSKIPTVPRPVECFVQGKTGLPAVPNTVVMTSMQREEMKYNKLFGSWSPPKLQDSCLDEDLDWLFQSRKPDVCVEKQRKIRDDGISCSSSSASWPRAQLLKEVDIYALPFTVPF